MSTMTLAAPTAAVPTADELTAARPKPTLKLTYRPLTEADTVAMARLHAAAYQDAGSSASSQLKLFWAGAYGDLIPEATLGAWAEDQLVGAVIVLNQAPDEWCSEGGACDQPFIADLFVDPEYRRQGIGSGLIMNASSAVNALGRESLTLSLDISEAPEAMQLYDALGFSTR